MPDIISLGIAGLVAVVWLSLWIVKVPMIHRAMTVFVVALFHKDMMGEMYVGGKLDLTSHEGIKTIRYYRNVFSLVAVTLALFLLPVLLVKERMDFFGEYSEDVIIRATQLIKEEEEAEVK